MELCLPAAEEPTNDVASPGASRRRVLVLGVGNVLLGDEGVGVHAIQLLKARGLAAQADLLDGGTGGFHLLGCWRDYERLILIDAAADGHPPGTVSVLHPQYARDFPPSLSAHDIGLKDLIESAALLGPLPPLDLVTISVGKLQPMSVALSPGVAAALPEVVRAVEALLAKSAAEEGGLITSPRG